MNTTGHSVESAAAALESEWGTRPRCVLANAGGSDQHWQFHHPSDSSGIPRSVLVDGILEPHPDWNEGQPEYYGQIDSPANQVAEFAAAVGFEIVESTWTDDDSMGANLRVPPWIGQHADESGLVSIQIGECTLTIESH